ncbi:hypothetical protein [Leptolyngbya sp. FACHB-261]|uniref:hypothetical protein n=1 Tax=Leptolyngbya sp. FACHB-261 TaxID=2692806 RepID=UPI00168A04DB|nr:hypothetical protein [Leptolyngbya sp. FACHB-261]
MQQGWLLSLGLFAGGLSTLAGVSPILAQQAQPARARTCSLAAPDQREDRLIYAKVCTLLLNVELTPRRQRVSRPAQLLDDFAPLDSLQTGRNAKASLLFNEGSLAIIGPDSVFRFERGLRSFQLKDRTTAPETIFKLNRGMSVVLSIDGSVVTRVETPGSQIEIRAEALPSARTLNKQEAATVLSSARRKAAVFVQYDPAAKQARVFALTPGDISVSNQAGEARVALQAGQTVAVTGGAVGPVREFDLESFYQTNELAAVLGPGQGGQVAQEAPQIQATLNAVRTETVRAAEIQSFRAEALTGGEPFADDDNSYRQGRSPRREEFNDRPGRFYRDTERTGRFVGNDGITNNLVVNFDNGTLQIDGVTGRESSLGLSGRRGSGTIINEDGTATRIEVFDLNGEEPNIPSGPFPGRIRTGRTRSPDR